MPKVALFSRVTAKEGKAEELIAAFRPVFEQVEKEPGTLVYALHRSRDDPGLFWVCELYADDDAFAAHRGSDAMAAAAPASPQAGPLAPASSAAPHPEPGRNQAEVMLSLRLAG